MSCVRKVRELNLSQKHISESIEFKRQCEMVYRHCLSKKENVGPLL